MPKNKGYRWWQGISSGLVSTILALSAVTMTYPMLERAGFPYGSSYAAILFLLGSMSIIVGCFFKIPIMPMPFLSLNTYLSYDLILSRGFSWQQVMLMLVILGVLLVILARCYSPDRLIGLLPPYLVHVLPPALGALLFYKGLIAGGIIISNPWQLTEAGSISDPRVAIFLLSLIAMLLMRGQAIALRFLAGIISGIIFLVMTGYMAVPMPIWGALPYLGEFLFFQGDIFSAQLLIPGMIVFLLLLVDGMIAQEIYGPGEGARGNFLYINGLGAILGGFLGAGGLGLAEISAFTRCGGIKGNISIVIAGILLLPLAFFLPILEEISSQGAIVGSLLAATGGILIFSFCKKRLHFLQKNDKNFSVAEFFAFLLTLFLVPLWGDLAAGIGIGFISYVLLSLFYGNRQQLRSFHYCLMLLFLLYFAVYM